MTQKKKGKKKGGGGGGGGEETRGRRHFSASIYIVTSLPIVTAFQYWFQVD